MLPPKCNICSYRQLHYNDRAPVYHHHFSSREVRILQGLEYSTTNRDYLCPTCQAHHPLLPDTGLNVCLAGSELHDFHHPNDSDEVCPPDRLHIDWVTLPGETVASLENAWSLDYRKCKRPMRILLVAGIDDIANGGSKDSLTNSILRLKNSIDDNNAYHPNFKNEFVVATVSNSPKYVWFPDAGPMPSGHPNKLEEFMDINRWIVEFNASYGNITPRFHRFGLKNGSYYQNGRTIPYTIHQKSQWRQEHPLHETVLLNDHWRIRMGVAVAKHFEGEIGRKGILASHQSDTSPP